jgi:hypothetical protein
VRGCGNRWQEGRRPERITPERTLSMSNKKASQRQAPSQNPALTLASTFALLLICAYAGMILGWLMARLLWGDRLWPLAVANSFPAVFFLPLPMAFVLAAFSRKRAAWVALCIPAFLWLALFGWRYLPRGSQVEASGAELRVMAFNILVTNGDAEAIAESVEAAQPDLIAFSELGTGMAAALAQRLGATYPYRTLHRLPDANFGSGIYSRWPLDDLGSLKTGLGLRSAAADVHTPEGTVRFVALHPRSTWLDRAARWTPPRPASKRISAAARRNWLRFVVIWTSGAIVL